MKVLHVLASCIYSGAEHVVCTMIKNMPLEYECIYLSPKGPIKERLEEEDISYYGVETLSLSEIKKAIVAIQPDIIHAHDFRASVLSAVVCKNKIRVISHIHCNPVWIQKISINSVLYRCVTPIISDVLSVSDAFLNQYRYRKHIEKKACVIGNPFSIEEIKELGNDNLCKEKKYDLIYVGRLESEKDPLKFIEICHVLKQSNYEIKAVMVGTGSLEKECKNLIEEYKIDTNVQMVGFQKNPYAYMSQSRISVITSKWEGFGLVALEAMVFGCPVVVSNVGGLGEIVEETCGKKCENLEQFVCEIKKLLTDSLYYKKKSDAALGRAREFDNIESYIKKLDEIYKK